MRVSFIAFVFCGVYPNWKSVDTWNIWIIELTCRSWDLSNIWCHV